MYRVVNPNGTMVARAYDVRLCAIRAIMNDQPSLTLPDCASPVTMIIMDGYGVELLCNDHAEPVHPKFIRDLLRYAAADRDILIIGR